MDSGDIDVLINTPNVKNNRTMLNKIFSYLFNIKTKEISITAAR